MSKIDMISAITNAMNKENDFVSKMVNERNPQIVEMVNLAKGRSDAYESVLYLIKTGSAGLL